MSGLYTRLTGVADYRKLIFLPPLVAVLMLAVTLTNGLEYGIDFQGGTWMDALTDRSLDAGQLESLEAELSGLGLRDVGVHVGFDVDTDKNKLTVQTTTVIEDRAAVRDVLEKYAGTLEEFDTASAETVKPPAGLDEKLAARLDQGINVEYTEGTLTVVGSDLDEEELESALTYYLGEPVDVGLVKKNFNLRSVGPTLGQTFREQGFKAMFIALALMGVVVFLAFRDFIPSIAVIQAAVTDLLIALGGMSLLGIPMEPASLAALLMLIGYSVDTDIMLTSRTLKDRGGELMEQMDQAMKTGLLMTSTTLVVMLIVYVISNTLTQITTLSSIASVLLIGLVADVATTWFTNAGILRWYLEKPGRRR